MAADDQPDPTSTIRRGRLVRMIEYRAAQSP
jgi:hypothetical protein